MIKLAQQKFDLNLSQSVLIGDTYTDLLAGFNAGIGKNFLIKHQATDKVGQWQSLQEAIRLDYKQNISISDDQNYFECEGVVFKNITHYQEVYL
jgi:histidinol phosphatase-like enzyme